MNYNLKTIATIHTDFGSKFGIPRQSGLLKKLSGVIRFEEDFRNRDALRGLEGFSHLWLLWIFSENVRDTWHPTVRPPRLGGNTRLGVFATRSSFRPNPIAMSVVKIEQINLETPNGPEIIVSGADLLDGTPIVDLKPYLPFADNIQDATGGFTDEVPFQALKVEISESEIKKVPVEKQELLKELLSIDPRPAYKASKEDPERVYGFNFAGLEIKFTVDNGKALVKKIEKSK